MKFNIYPYWKL